MPPSRRPLILLIAIAVCICTIGAFANRWTTTISRPTLQRPQLQPQLDPESDTVTAAAANLTELSEFDLPPKQRWILATHLLSHHNDGVRVPLVGVSSLIHARLQSCRPTLPPDPRQLPPSLRRPPSNGRTQPSEPYAQLECVQAWAENVLLASNRAGVLALPISVPESRLSGADPPALLTASTRRLQLRLLRQCAHYTPSDLMWMSMMNFSPDGSATKAAAARGEREWDPQGLAALLINSPKLPGFDAQLETRQVLWPFNPADGVHELDLSILPRMMLIDEPAAPPHPFLPPVLEKLSLAQRLQRYGSSMSHWQHLLWMLPLSILAAVALLRLTSTVRSSALMQRTTDGMLHVIELTQDSLHATLHLWRWYWRDRLQPLDNAIEERTKWIRQRVGAAADGIGAAAAAVQARLQPAIDFISRPRIPSVRQVLDRVSLQLRAVAHKMRDSRFASLATDVSRTVTKAFFGVASPSPPAPFDYSTPLASPMSTASTEGGDELVDAVSRGRMVRERQRQRMRSPFETVTAQDAREHFQDLVEELEPLPEATADRMRLQQDRSKKEEEQDGEGERKQFETQHELKMDAWGEAVKNREAQRALHLLSELEGSSSGGSPSAGSRASSGGSISASSSASSVASVSPASRSQAST